MMLLLICAVVAALLVITIKLLAVALLEWGKDQPQPEPEVWPPVAILLAARNEAHTLERCLAALARLDYPANKLRVWIGNDASTDRTREVAEAFCSNRAGWEVCDIQEQWGQARGKANVLAQLAGKAAPFADYYFITDADVAVNPAWLKGLLRYAAPGVGIVSGSTVVEGKERISRQQRYDWALALGLAKAYTYLPLFGETLSAIGNNMLVSKEAYESVGGYGHIPFSITEDYELHRQLKKKGYRSLHIARPEVKAYTLAEAGTFKLLHQRKRWMHGAMQLPLPMVLILFVQALFMPAVLLLLFFLPLLGITILLAKLLSQAMLIRKMLHRMQEPVAFPFIGYELYSLVLNMSLVVFYFLPVRVKWKDRRY
jgi:1,2-diacylglycerol 3-beta-glucosyltransferase